MKNSTTKTLLGLTGTNTDKLYSKPLLNSLEGGCSHLVSLSKTLLEDDLLHIDLYTKYLKAFGLRLESLCNQDSNGLNYLAFTHVVWTAQYSEGIVGRQLQNALKELWIGNEVCIRDCKQMGGSFCNSLFKGDLADSLMLASSNNKDGLERGLLISLILPQIELTHNEDDILDLHSMGVAELKQITFDLDDSIGKDIAQNHIVDGSNSADESDTIVIPQCYVDLKGDDGKTIVGRIYDFEMMQELFQLEVDKLKI